MKLVNADLKRCTRNVLPVIAVRKYFLVISSETLKKLDLKIKLDTKKKQFQISVYILFIIKSLFVIYIKILLQIQCIAI